MFFSESESETLALGPSYCARTSRFQTRPPNGYFGGRVVVAGTPTYSAFTYCTCVPARPFKLISTPSPWCLHSYGHIYAQLINTPTIRGLSDCINHNLSDDDANTQLIHRKWRNIHRHRRHKILNFYLLSSLPRTFTWWYTSKERVYSHPIDIWYMQDVFWYLECS